MMNEIILLKRAWCKISNFSTNCVINSGHCQHWTVEQIKCVGCRLRLLLIRYVKMGRHITFYAYSYRVQLRRDGWITIFFKSIRCRFFSWKNGCRYIC